MLAVSSQKVLFSLNLFHFVGKSISPPAHPSPLVQTRRGKICQIGQRTWTSFDLIIGLDRRRVEKRLFMDDMNSTGGG
jgi:hypothetical protein